MKNIFYLLTLIAMLASCKTKEEKNIGSIDRMDTELNSIIDENAKIELLAEGFKWSEGPVWIDQYKMLLFSDVPNNIVHKWTEEKGLETYLTPSGFTGTGKYSKEPGANGLTLNNEGKLILCQHGDRRVAMMSAPLDAPKPDFISIADNFNGKKLNSPNDAVYRSNGDMFFTDPPYGLPNQENDSTKETPHNGVYKVAGGQVTLMVDSLTRPNGIAFLPGEKTFIVANSDPAKAIWYAFDLAENDSITNARIFHDATALTKTEKGLPDGFRVDKQGNIFASGPGGIWIFNKGGKVIGKIRLTEPASNCALSDDEKTLFVTNNMYLLRIKMRN
jgi:gluconolactonase